MLIFFFIFLLGLCSSVEINLIPSFGPSPPLITSSNAIYDEMTSSLITIGGFNTESNQLISEIYTFSLLNNIWGEIIPESEYIPEPFQDHYLHLTKSRVILVLFPVTNKGLLSDIFEFDLKTFKWEKKTLTGEPISSRKHSSICSFSHNGTDYIAVYGGFRKSGYDENLYLIDSDSLISYKLSNNGLVNPGIKDSASLIYYEGKLFLYGISYTFYEFASEEILFIYDLESFSWSKIMIEGNNSVTAFHKAKIQGKYMFVYFGHDSKGPTNIVRKLDLESYLWEDIGSISDKNILAYISCENKEILYIIYGYSKNEIYDPIMSINIVNHPTKIIKVAPRIDWPRKRKGHCMVTINDKLILIGGLAEDDTTYLNDVWRLDIDTVIWTKLIITGDIFEGRAYMSCHVNAGTTFVTGGKNNDYIFDQTFYLNHKSYTWTKVKSISYTNTENYGSCVINSNYVYITFGISSKGFIETIFIYNFTDNTIKASYRASGPKIQLVNHVCWIKKKGDSDEIYIANGKTLNGMLNRYLYKVSIFVNDSEKYYSEVVIESDELARTMTALVYSDDVAFILFGVMGNGIVSDSIVYFDYERLEVGSLKNTGLYAYGHAASHLRDKIFVFGSGGIQGRSTTSSASSKLYEITNSNVDSIQFGCGPGSKAPDCKPCPQGSYYNDNKDCEDCPAGTYSYEFGAISMLSCTLCSSNYYSDDKGNQYCKECPITSFCPLGTIFPLPPHSFNEALKYSQPSSYKSNKAYVSEINNLAFYTFITFSFLLIIFLILSRYIREKVKKIDIFTSSHGGSENEPIIIKKTLFGGYFSCMFYIAALLIIISYIASFIKDNIDENKTLIPLVIENRSIYSEIFNVSVELSMYGGSCDYYPNGSIKIMIDEMKLNYSKKKTRLHKPLNEIKKCIFEILYEDFSIHYESQIVIEIRDFIAHARMIKVKMETNSSIPNENSIYEQSIIPDLITEVFNGNSYSEFFVKVTPSIFESESNLWPSLSKGFHLSQSQIPLKGSTANEKTLSVVDGVFIKINMSQSDNLLYTKRILKTTLFVIVSSLTGTVFGVMGSFGSIMAFLEGKLGSLSRKIAKFKKFRDIIRIRKNIKNLFSESYSDKIDKHYDPWNTSHDILDSVKSAKVMPASNFIENLDI
ncbi:hypothetical protein SteCoe_992 [Stentor coeruleus]|uniref:Tyrosine-protein kinase ephrin type A/B receptor-like domain-containing protein n=1 Tax=Stentor coeruleus TaxID=5963 RepID=A0A1R2D2Z0_9CILI|nr:hypothetical protein SteCoe_992 [Stentor coeruleus]